MSGKIKCLCGGTAHLEHFAGLRTLVTGKPEYRVRFVCDRCKEGLYNISGYRTKQKAYDGYMKKMEIAKELANEFNVSVQEFLIGVNK